jgi:Tfp pilus assembly protein PilO
MQKLALIGIICLVILVVDYQFLLSAQFRSIADAKNKISQAKSDIVKLEADIRLMQEFKKKAQTPQKTQRLITEEDVPAVLKDISDVANKYQLRVMQIRTSREAYNPKSKSTILGVMISLDIFGSYYNFMRFLSDMESKDIFLRLNDISIQSVEATPLIQNIKLSFKTYIKI